MNQIYRINDRVRGIVDGEPRTGEYVAKTMDGKTAMCRTWNPTVKGGWEYWCCAIKDLEKTGQKQER